MLVGVCKGVGMYHTSFDLACGDRREKGDSLLPDY